MQGILVGRERERERERTSFAIRSFFITPLMSSIYFKNMNFSSESYSLKFYMILFIVELWERHTHIK
jgi:hypothetical protein